MTTLDALMYKEFIKNQQAKKGNVETDAVNNKPKNGSYYKEDQGKIILSATEKLFDTSYGTEPIFIRIEKLFTEQHNRSNTVLFNICTLIRNSMDKNLTMEDNVKRIELEISLTIERIKFLYENFGVIKYPYLIFYMTNHHKDYNQESVRPKTPGKWLYDDLCDLFWANLPEGVQKIENITIKYKLLNEGADYGFQLQKLIRGINDVIPQTQYSGDYFLITHYPLDFYLLNKCPNGKLIASHTGEVIEKRMLGYKVFDDPYIPFNQVLHGVLGDKYQIKPTAKIASRPKIKELAFKNNWQVKTESQIKKDLRNIGIYVN